MDEELRPLISAGEESRRSTWLGFTSGWLTIGGMVVTVIAVQSREIAAYPLPIFLLGLGSGCTLVAGITWAHTPGQRKLKTVFLGLIGALVGALTCGYLGGEVLAARDNLSQEIWGLLGGFWFGAILCGGLGVWWGKSISRR